GPGIGARIGAGPRLERQTLAGDLPDCDSRFIFESVGSERNVCVCRRSLAGSRPPHRASIASSSGLNYGPLSLHAIAIRLQKREALGRQIDRTVLLRRSRMHGEVARIADLMEAPKHCIKI